MLFKIRSYFRFLWKSKNEHGVHSPFVFNLVARCFYSKKKYPEYEVLKHYRDSMSQYPEISQKQAELLFRLAKYIRPAIILQDGNSSGLSISALHLGNPEAKIVFSEIVTQNPGHYNLVYFDCLRKEVFSYSELLPTITNDTIWIFREIHRSPKTEEIWEIIKKYPKVTVTIDTFRWGFVFFRKEQEKEHFTIRL